jgi:hypothetical protein
LKLRSNRMPILNQAAIWTIASLIAFSLSSISRSQPQVPKENSVHFQGEVRRGDKFEKEIGNNLAFRLAPDEYGWNIEVGPTKGDENFTNCVNTPVHGITAQQIQGWHFRTDDNTEARKPRDFLTAGIGAARPFYFVVNSADEAKSCNDLDKVLYIYDEENPEHKKAMARWGTLVGGKGSLTITDFTLGNLMPGARAWIELLKFNVTILFLPKPGTKKTSKSK